MDGANPPKAMIVLAMLLVPLVVWAVLAGLFVENLYGSNVDASIYAQGIGQDLVTLVFALPVTFVSLVLTMRGSLKGYLLLLGQFAYLAYTYFSACLLWPPNPMFPVHVVIYSSALFALVIGVLGLDIRNLPGMFKSSFPRRTLAGYLVFAGVGIALLWIGRFVAPLLAPGMDPDKVLAGAPNLVIQALDLGIVAPLAIVGGILLWLDRPWGYALASIMLVKAATMLLAITGMMIAMGRAGVPAQPAELVLFSILCVVGVGLLALFIASVRRPEVE